MANREIPGQQTLDETPTRVFKFLIGLAQSVPARAALTAKGFTQAEHDYAWSRLKALGTLPGLPAALDAEVRSAVVELDGWDGPNFEAIESTLLRQFPAQAAFVFEGLTAAEGAQAVLGVEKLLSRLDALETGKGRANTREDDQRALAVLADRGYPKAERERLQTLVNVAKTIKPAPPMNDESTRTLQLELYRWLSEWSAHARNAPLGRSTLIALGLAERRKKAEEPAPPPAPAASRSASN